MKRGTITVVIPAFVLLLILQLHNAWYHPVIRGFDATGHIAYIQYIQRTHSLPITSEGWELYQAPLYYLIGSLFTNVQWLKVLGVILWGVLLYVAYRLFRQYGPDRAIIGVWFIAMLPVVLYSSISISNEFFSAVLISLALVFYGVKRSSTMPRALILGVLLGLAIAAKATAWVLVVSIVLDQLLQRPFRVRIKHLFFMIITMIAVGGMHYIRNAMFYGNPFIAPHNLPDLFSFNQPVVPRNTEFFTTLRGFLTMDLFQSHHYSFLSGTYFSWFYDAHNVIVPVQAFSKAGALLVLLSIPSLLCIGTGFMRTIKRMTGKTRIFIIYSVLLFASYVAYNVQLPYYSTVKGSFLLSAAIPIGYFFLAGLGKNKKLLPFVSLYLLIYTMIVLKHFWILDWWY